MSVVLICGVSHVEMDHIEPGLALEQVSLRVWKIGPTCHYNNCSDNDASWGTKGLMTICMECLQQMGCSWSSFSSSWKFPDSLR